jgi:integrase-like protein
VLLLNCVYDFICVKHYSPRIEQPYLDWIERFIHFHGKRHPPGVEAYLQHLDKFFIDRSWPTSTDQ